MKIMLVTDAWEPQVNGVVRTLKTTARELAAMGHEVRFLTPLEFRTLPCPTYPEIRLSLFPGAGVERRIREFDPDVLHIATHTLADGVPERCALALSASPHREPCSAPGRSRRSRRSPAFMMPSWSSSIIR